jgi:CBS domain-containing protein
VSSELATDDIIDFLKSVPPFQFLDAETLKTVAGRISTAWYPTNTYLLKQDGPPSEHLLIIKQGGVKVFVRSEEGDDVLTDYRGEGDVIGYLSLFSSDKSRANVVTIEDTQCYLLDRDAVQRLMDGNAAVRDFFHQSFLKKYLDKTFQTMHDRGLMPGCGSHLLLTTPVVELVKRGVISEFQDITIQEAAAIMSKNRIGSLVIIDSNAVPVGIVTNRDLRDKVITPGRDIKENVGTIMSAALITAGTREYCFEALLKMMHHNVHHLLVVEEGKIIGIITNHDIMMLQGTSPITVARDIESRKTVDQLAGVSEKTNQLIALLLKEGTKATVLAKIISEINDRMLKKILDFAEKKFGKPPLPYCWIALGSEGRKEQTFKTDQDNAIIFADPSSSAEEERAREFFPDFTAFVRDSLVKCGFPLCPGSYMASNIHWCQPLDVWKKYFASWIRTPTADALLSSLIFFDFRPLHGDFALAEELRNYLVNMIDGNKVFLGSLANTIIKNRPPIGFMKSFIVEKSGEHKNKLDLKIKGVAMLVDIARLFALERGVRETATIDRIEALKEKHTIVKEYSEEMVQAFEFMMFRRIQHQFEQVGQEIEPDNFINPNMLSNLDKRFMRDAFQLITRLQDMIIERYKSMIW